MELGALGDAPTALGRYPRFKPNLLHVEVNPFMRMWRPHVTQGWSELLTLLLSDNNLLQSRCPCAEQSMLRIGRVR